ncbi:tyrosine-protein phosphatase [Isoptericola jiangsuensis]|uniref:tyrosine-protein phosphatase n=1 Tax=Isoptericola jiangsuensis TaxID=548579 RepID=UPI003AAD50CC
MSVEIPVAPDHLVNLRDVASAEVSLQPGVLLRSDAPRAGDTPPDDVAWPPRTVLDLRDLGEKRDPHPLRDVADVRELPVLDGATRAAPAQDALPFDLGRLYVEMLHGVGAAHLVDGVDAVATAPGPVLVHCTAGKDRTGVLVAVVLALVGVDRAHIVTDYVRTDPHMPAVIARARRTARAATADSHVLAALPPELLTAPPHAIGTVLDFLDEHTGGAEGWFAAHGGTPETLRTLRERLLR